MFEKNVNLAVALNFLVHCNDLGDTYYILRDTDKYVRNDVRAYEANSLEAQCFISIHHNGDTNTTSQYTVALYDSLAETDRDFPGLLRDTDSTLALKIQVGNDNNLAGLKNENCLY